MIIRIIVIEGTGFVFDVESLKELREKYQITGVLAGVLPQFPQQNVFMGLPAQLLPEDLEYIADLRIAQITDADGWFPEVADDASERRETALIPKTKRNSYAMYKYLRAHDFFIMPGLKFGCNYMAYPGDPLRYHAHYNTKGVSWTQKFQLLEVVGAGRLATSVKKCWVIGADSAEDCAGDSLGDNNYRVFSIEWAGFG